MAKTLRSTRASFLVLIFSFVACTSGGTESTPAPAANPIPRLAAGPHMGFIEGFDDLSQKPGEPDRATRVAMLRDEAISAGMTVGRAQVDWGELETAPGVFDADALDGALDRAESGDIAVFVTLSTIDTFELTLPADLMGNDNLLRDNLRLDGEVVANRFLAFLDWLTPRLAGRNVWGLAIGNEVDGIVFDHVLKEQEVLAHLLSGAERVNQLDPDMAVTVTLTGDANTNVRRFTNRLIAGLDIVSFNTYCLKSDLTVSGPDEWARVLKRWRRTAGDKQIFIQELGCPVGYGDDGAGAPLRPGNGLSGSPDIQAEYIAYHMEQFAADDQLRAATVFQLFDWSPELAGIYTGMFIDAGEPLAGARLEEWLATVGLCRWADVTCRPAWGSFLDGLPLLEQARWEMGVR